MFFFDFGILSLNFISKLKTLVKLCLNSNLSKHTQYDMANRFYLFACIQYKKNEN